MSNAKTTTKKKTATTTHAPKAVVQQQVIQEPVQVQPSATPVEEKVYLSDNLQVRVQSNVFGRLIYINQRTGDRTDWNNFGDIQTLTVGDLRAMRGTQRKFYENNWIFIRGIDERGYENMTPEDIYKELSVSQYYKNSLDPANFDEIFTMDSNELKYKVDQMSADAKMNLIVAANDAILDGRLDSLGRIRSLEQLLGCELVHIE